MREWESLIVTDSDGKDCGTLGEIVIERIHMLDHAEINPGILSLPDYFISREGEKPDYDTPRGVIDWTGFKDAVKKARGLI